MWGSRLAPLRLSVQAVSGVIGVGQFRSTQSSLICDNLSSIWREGPILPVVHVPGPWTG